MNIMTQPTQTYQDVVSEPPMPSRIKWHVEPKKWRETTLGELVNQIECRTMTEMKEQEIAYFVLNNAPHVGLWTRCKIGTAARCKVIRIGNKEYRSHDWRLHWRYV